MNKLFLDIDGVLNADDHATHWPDSSKAKILINRGGGYRESFTIRWSPTMIDQLRRTVTDHNIHVVWVSTWCEDQLVHKIEHALGWAPDGATIAPCTYPANADDETRSAWKLDTVTSELNPGDTAVWVDDTVVPVHGAAAHTHAEQVGANLLTIAPPLDPETGLTPEMLEQIREHFAAARN